MALAIAQHPKKFVGTAALGVAEKTRGGLNLTPP